MEKIIAIGKTVYIVHKNWSKTQKEGAKVLSARITGYQNVSGEVLPILKSGSKEVDAENNHIFTDIKEAVEAIRTK
jgi:hypothetical protein